MAFFFGYSFYSWFFSDVSTLDSFVFIMYSVGVSEPPGPPNIARCIPLKGHGEGHPRRPRGCESISSQGGEPLGTLSCKTSSEQSQSFWHLIGARKSLCFSAQSE